MPPPTFSYEKTLVGRLDAVRSQLIVEAEAGGWDYEAVDRIMLAGGMEPWTHEYVVYYNQTTSRETTVRATSPDHAAVVAHLDETQGLSLQGVREVPPKEAR